MFFKKRNLIGYNIRDPKVWINLLKKNPQNSILQVKNSKNTEDPIKCHLTLKTLSLKWYLEFRGEHEVEAIYFRIYYNDHFLLSAEEINTFREKCNSCLIQNTDNNFIQIVLTFPLPPAILEKDEWLDQMIGRFWLYVQEYEKLVMSKKEKSSNNSKNNDNLFEEAWKGMLDEVSKAVLAKIPNIDYAYLFLLEELDGASGGDELSQEFAKNSGIPAHEYKGALSGESLIDEVDGPQQTLMFACMSLENNELRPYLRRSVTDRVMQVYKLGKYSL